MIKAKLLKSLYEYQKATTQHHYFNPPHTYACTILTIYWYHIFVQITPPPPPPTCTKITTKFIMVQDSPQVCKDQHHCLPACVIQRLQNMMNLSLKSATTYRLTKMLKGTGCSSLPKKALKGIHHTVKVAMSQVSNPSGRVNMMSTFLYALFWRAPG